MFELGSWRRLGKTECTDVLLTLLFPDSIWVVSSGSTSHWLLGNVFSIPPYI